MKYDAIIVLAGGINDDGSLTKLSKLRVDKAIELYNKGMADNLIISGKWSFLRKTNPPKTEAQAMKDYAVTCGAANTNLFLEEMAMDTVGNAYFSKIEYLNQKKWNKVIVVTSSFHMRRTRFVFDFILGKNYEIKYIKAPSKISIFEWFSRIKLEYKLTHMYKKMIDLTKSGDDGYLKRLMFVDHPVYADDAQDKKELILKKLGIEK